MRGQRREMHGLGIGWHGFGGVKHRRRYAQALMSATKLSTGNEWLIAMRRQEKVESCVGTAMKRMAEAMHSMT